MIRGIWLRIAALLSLAVLPIMVLQLKLQTDSVGLVFDMADRTGARQALDDFLSQLRENARVNPEKEPYFRERFQLVSQVKRSLEEFFLARPSIDRDVRSQTIVITLAVLTASLLGSILISRGIVKKVRLLMEERERAATKLRDLNTLKNWQGVARVLVHELRAPITPIKLVSTDITHKYAALDQQNFARYLVDAQRLVNEQIAAIETMIDGFTRFGKLPSPDLQLKILDEFLDEFGQLFGNSFGDGVALSLRPNASGAVVSIDSKLMRDLVFNICKNAAEANAGITNITLSTQSLSDSVCLLIHNTGARVPAEIRSNIFDPYVSTKLGAEKPNMGLGLTIARKIALDHLGDLILLEEGDANGPTFQIKLPRVTGRPG